MDYVAVTALIVAVIGALGHFIKDAHIQKCHMCCVDSDCREKKGTPALTPEVSTSELKTEL